MAEVNPFDIEFADEDRPSRSLDKWNGIVDKTSNPSQELKDWIFEQALRKEHPDWSEEQIQEMLNIKDDEEPVDVPEIETEVVDLPPEDENEKEIIVDNNPKDSTMGDGVEEVNPDDIQLEGDVIDNDGEYYENSVSGEEVGDPSIAPSDEEIADVKDTKKPEESGEDANKKDEPKEEKKEPMSDEDALKEAQELAQDELNGFKISGANWEKMSEKQKAEAIKAFKDANKKEDHRTYNSKDESTTNNFETYERYPTGLKVASMAGNALQTAGEDVGRVAKTVGKEGTSSGSIANEVARAVPHFDYRSLFR